MGNTNLKIKYYGKSGGEQFSVSFMGKRYNFKNIGTNPKEKSQILNSDKATDMVIHFGNAGTEKVKMFKEKKERVCRRTRRWGKRRRRCSDKITKIPYMKKIEKRITIKKIEINGFDLTSYIVFTTTSCDPDSGNVSSTDKIDNGILIKGGQYRIPKSIIQQAIGKFVPKPTYDECEAKIPPLDKTIATHKSDLNKMTDKYTQKSVDYDKLLAQFNKVSGLKKEADNKVNIAGKKIKILNNEGQDLQSQLNWAESNVQSQSQASAGYYQQYMTSEGKYYQDIEKENIGLTNENKNRDNANTTFKQKVFYKKETNKNLKIYNTIALYLYFFLVFSYICISVYVDSKNNTIFNNKYGKILFVFIAIIYPFVILTFTKYILNFLNYFYSIFNGITYEKIN